MERRDTDSSASEAPLDGSMGFLGTRESRASEDEQKAPIIEHIESDASELNEDSKYSNMLEEFFDELMSLGQTNQQAREAMANRTAAAAATAEEEDDDCQY